MTLNIANVNECAHLILANHRHLLHWMQNIIEHLIRMLPMDFVRALDTEVKRRRGFGSEGDGDTMIVADLTSFRVSGVRAAVPLAHERSKIV